MNKIVNVENSELEAIKQLALEIALRLNVLQGESLLSETADARKISTAKQAANENEILVGKVVIVASFLAGLIISSACGAGAWTPIFSVAGMVVGLGLHIAYNKNKKNKEMPK